MRNNCVQIKTTGRILTLPRPMFSLNCWGSLWRPAMLSTRLSVSLGLYSHAIRNLFFLIYTAEANVRIARTVEPYRVLGGSPQPSLVRTTWGRTSPPRSMKPRLPPKALSHAIMSLTTSLTSRLQYQIRSLYLQYTPNRLPRRHPFFLPPRPGRACLVPRHPSRPRDLRDSY